MPPEPLEFGLRARWVFPVDGPPLADGVVTIVGDRIVAVGGAASAKVLDLGQVAIVPGLVNAHTHLEFSDLTHPLGHAGMSLPDWIRLVLAHRRAAAPPAIQQGLAESVRAGVVALGEIATRDWRLVNSSRDGDPLAPAVAMFWESIAPTRQRVAESLASAEKFLSTERSLPAQGGAPDSVAGLSPHAPYTVHLELLSGLVQLARQRDVPLAMHLAESREEIELLKTGAGPFRELLEDLNAWSASPGARGSSVLEYLQSLAAAPRALAIHGNYLSGPEVEFLAQHADTMSLVYCPRTHAFFRHEPYPLVARLAAGVAVALGTDSRASNPDLGLWDEMRQVLRHHADISPAQVLELGTLAGARALGRGDTHGKLAVDKQADLAIVSLPDGDTPDAYESLFDSRSRVTATWIAGQPVTMPANNTDELPTSGNS